MYRGGSRAVPSHVCHGFCPQLGPEPLLSYRAAHSHAHQGEAASWCLQPPLNISWHIKVRPSDSTCASEACTWPCTRGAPHGDCTELIWMTIQTHTQLSRQCTESVAINLRDCDTCKASMVGRHSSTCFMHTYGVYAHLWRVSTCFIDRQCVCVTLHVHVIVGV